MNDASLAVTTFEIIEWWNRRMYYARSRQIDFADLPGGGMWIFTSHMRLSQMHRSIYDRWTSALHYLEEVHGNKYPGYSRLEQAASTTATIEAELPAVRVTCDVVQTFDFPGPVLLNFPVLPEHGEFSNQDPLYQTVNVTSTIVERYGEKIDPRSDDLASIGIQLPPHDGQSASLGLVIVNPTVGMGWNAGSQELLACSVDARWAKGKSVIQEDLKEFQTAPIYNDQRLLAIQSGLTEEFSASLVPPNDGTWRRIKITTGWFDQLASGIPAEKNNNDDKDTPRITLDTVLHEAVQMVGSHSYRWAFEFVHALLIVDGISRSSCHRPQDFTGALGGLEFLFSETSEPVIMEKWANNSARAEQMVTSGEPKDQYHPPGPQEFMKTKMTVKLNGYAMALSGWFDYFCVAILLTHSVIGAGAGIPPPGKVFQC